MKKKAFTFAELMISLVVISVLSAILYPMIAQFTPNSNKPLFKAAYRVLVDVIGELTANSTTGELIIPSTGDPMTGEELCTAFCEKVNTVPKIEDETSSPPRFESSDCATQCGDKIITTTNGMRWYFGDNGTYTDPMDEDEDEDIEDVFQVFVDVNASNNDLPSVDNCNSLIDATDTTNKGEFCYAPTDVATGIYTALPTPTSPDGTFSIEKLKIQDTFEILIDKKGKIVSMSPAGWANLEENFQAVD